MPTSLFLQHLKGRSYYKRNTEVTNELISKLIFISSFIGIVFIICTKVNLFHIPFINSVLIFSTGTVFSIFQHFLNKKEKFREYLKYQGLIFIAIYFTLIAVTPGVGLSILIAFILTPFLSTLYLYTRLTWVTSIISYLCMLFSLFIKAHQYNLLPDDISVQMNWFFTESIGYSIVYFFVFVIALNVSKTFKTTLELEYKKKQEIKKLQLDLLETFANIIEWSDSYTGEHIKRTSKYVKLIAEEFVRQNHYVEMLTPEKIYLFTTAAPLHDIGKISVPTEILNKPGKFTDEEFAIMKRHAQTGYDIIATDLSKLEDKKYIETAEQMALFHHEKWDGTGYPMGLKGYDIPLCGRIMAAADVLDALLSKRQYKNSFSMEKTFEIIKSESGKHFEPCIVEAVLNIKDEIAEIANS